MPAPVDRGLVFRSELIEVRANRCARTDAAMTPATEPMSCHEIVLAQHGLWLRHLGRRALPVDCNHVHFFHRGESHRVSHPGGCGDCNTGLVLTGPALRDVLPGANADRPFPATHARMDGRTALAHRRVLAACAARAEPVAIEELALALAASALGVAEPSMQQPSPLPRSQRDLVAAVLAQLHTDLAEPLTLQRLACAVGASPCHVSRVFARGTGMALFRYRERVRLQAALAQVLDTNTPLADIAARTGFADRSHLSRRLRAYTGQSPQAIRSRGCSG